MNLKCVDCDKDAEYVFKGMSYCKDHLLKAKPPKGKPMTKEDIPSFGISMGAGGLRA
jgi:hypothetical protein